MDDVIDYMRFDAKHHSRTISFRLKMPTRSGIGLQPWGHRCRFLADPRLSRSESGLLTCLSVLEEDGYAIGTGNSVPEYIPTDNYVAMLSTLQ